MIKLHSAGLAPDCTEHGSVSTGCRTVGDFMTEAAAVYGGKLTIKVDGWINIYKVGEKRIIDGLFKSKEEADKAVGISDVFHIATVRIEWEEVQ